MRKRSLLLPVLCIILTLLVLALGTLLSGIFRKYSKAGTVLGMPEEEPVEPFEHETEIELLPNSESLLCWKYENGELTITDDAAYKQQIMPEGEIHTLVLKEGVTEWRELSFCNLSAVERVILPNTLKRIYSHAASDIHAQIVIPGNVEQISPLALPIRFDNISLSPENGHFSLRDGFLIENKTGTLIQYGGTAKKVIVPEGVTTVGECVFLGIEQVESIVLPDTVLSIECSSFVFCDNLTEIILSRSLKTIKDEVLCACDRLLCITVPDGVFFDINAENEWAFAGNIRRITFEGSFTYFSSPFLRSRSVEQLVFLKTKPENIIPEEAFRGMKEPTIYYLNTYNQSWAPNGETEWNGIPIIGIDSLDDLPPVE